MSNKSPSNHIEEIHDSEVLSSPDPEMGKLFQNHGSHLQLEMNGKNWTLEMAENLRYYAYDAYKLSWQTGQDAFYWNSYNTKLTLWATILSAISTLGFVPIIALVDIDNIRWLFYLFTGLNMCLVLFVGILNGLRLVYNVGTKIAEHSEKTAKFGNLYRRIKNQFFMPTNIRYNAKTLLDFTTERFNELDAEKLFIRPHTEKKWEEQLARTDVGEIDYDAILVLPEELRNRNPPEDHVRRNSDEIVINIEELKKQSNGKRSPV